MAILGNLIVQGDARFLQGITADTLSVVSSLETPTVSTNQIIIDNKEFVSATDYQLLINSENYFPEGVYFGEGGIKTDGVIQVGTDGAVADISTNGATFGVDVYPSINNASLGTQAHTWEYIYGFHGVFTGDLAVSGGTTFNGTNTFNGNSIFIGDLLSQDAEFEKVRVRSELRATNYILDNVASIGGTFYVSPALYCQAPTVQVSNKGNTSATLQITDNMISSDELGGTTWYAGSKVKISGRIDNVVLGSVDGTLSTKMNSTAHVLNIAVSFAGSDPIAELENGTYTDIQNLIIMLYEVNYNNTGQLYPLGIYMTSYGDAKKPTIDIFGGNSGYSDPNVRIGFLNGLPAMTVGNSSFTPQGWGIYSNNGYYKGTIVTNSGAIGNWRINDDSLYYGDLGTGVWLSPVGTQGSANIAGSGLRSGWAFTSSNTFGVTSGGDLFANSGKISNFYINESSIYNGEFGTAGSVLLSTGYTTSAGIGTITGENEYAFGAGAHFGVTTAGYFTSSAGNIAGWEISPTALSHGRLGTPFGYILDSAGQTETIINNEPLSGLMMVVGSNFAIDKDGIIYTNGGVFSGDIIGGTITSKNYSSDSYIKTATGAYVLLSDDSKLKKAREDNYSNHGMMIDLNRGIISTANFYIAEDGSVNIRNVTMGGAHTIGLVSTEQYLPPSVGNENYLINSNGSDSISTKYFSSQGIKLNLNDSGFLTSENFAITGDGSTYINGEIRGHLGSTNGLIIGDTGIYKGTSSMSSITPGIYYGVDGFRNFTQDGKYATISDGVINTTERVTVGATNGNHMVFQENAGMFQMVYYNSSNVVNSTLQFGSGARGHNAIVIAPYTDYVGFGSSSGIGLQDYLKKLIAWICATYPNRSRNIFIGCGSPAALGIYSICVYSTFADQMSNGVPKYAFGHMNLWNSGFYVFGYNQYNFYFKTATMT